MDVGMPVSLLVSPSHATGEKRQIELPGTDLWIMDRIDNVFIYPKKLNVDKLEIALARTLSLWPLVAGRFLLLDPHRYVIEMSDNAIPVTIIEDMTVAQCPFDPNKVVIDLKDQTLETFIDEIPIHELLSGSRDEPLLRLKMTYLIRTGECILGISWAHVLGDAMSCLRFFNTLSMFYQDLPSPEPTPIFERRLWDTNRADSSLLNKMKSWRDSGPAEQMFQSLMAEQTSHDQLNLHFSGEQLKRIRTLAGGDAVTIQDALTAYIIRTLNLHCFQSDPDHLILRTDTAVNFRGVSNAIAPLGLIANSVFMMLSDDFDDPYSLSNIAKTIRRSIHKARDVEFLESWLCTADTLMRKMARDACAANSHHAKNEIVVNSNLRYDWASLVDFGHTNQCRFHTVWTGVLYLRVFHLNPTFDGTQWIAADHQGAEVAFRLDSRNKDKFMQALQNDVGNKFSNIDQ